MSSPLRVVAIVSLCVALCCATGDTSFEEEGDGWLHMKSTCDSTHEVDVSPSQQSDLIRANSKRPIFFFPGLASSKLTAWKYLDCPGLPDIEIGDRVWLSVGKVLLGHLQDNCWIHCMKLNASEQTDIPQGCKLRPDQGLESIMELQPGLITGQMSSIFKDLIFRLAEDFDYDSNSMYAVSYDWRLPPAKLEERDRFFTKLKIEVERAVLVNHNQSGVVIAHSMGNNVFQYFLKWLEKTMGITESKEWIDRHFKAYFAVGAPLLGSAEAVRALVSGVTAGLPIPQESARKLGNTWGSGSWLLPFSRPDQPTPWSIPVAKVKFHDSTLKASTFTAELNNFTNGDLFKALSPYDQGFKDLFSHLERFYWGDPIFEPYPPAASRPPIQNVYAIYGVNLPTDIGYEFEEYFTDDFILRNIDATIGKNNLVAEILALRQKFLLKKIYFEDGDIVWESQGEDKKDKIYYMKTDHPSGDGTVPYASLSWAHTWHPKGAVVEKRFIASVFHEFGENAFAHVSENYFGNFMDTVEPSVSEYKSRYEDDEGKTYSTRIIEMQAIQHRHIIKNAFFLKLLRQYMAEEIIEEFVHKGE